MTDGIAIVGMACRYPDADSPEALWQTALARRQAFRRMPAERLNLDDYAPGRCNAADSIYPIQVALLENYAFDRARHMVPAAAFAAADLTHWLALDVATEALADAGLATGGAYRRRTGVVVGNSLTGEFSRAGLLRYRWPYVRRQLDAALQAEGFEDARRNAFLAGFETRFKDPFPPPNEESLAGGLANTIAGRIANHHDLKGGGYTVDGACASSLLAVVSACRRLAAGEVDIVLAGGVDLSLDPFELVGFARNGALAKAGMHVFDRRSDGFLPGEGCGFVVLMREAQARAQGHGVRSVIRGWGVSSDGQGGLTRPTAAGQVEAMQRAYAVAGIDAGTVPLFEAHGTGTTVGDVVEIEAIATVRRAAGARFPAAVGSIKANIGHTKAAAGLAGLLKQVMALDKQILPAATACDDPHPIFEQQGDMVAPLAESRRWPDELPLHAGVSALGFGGINVHLALDGGDAPRRSGVTPEARRQMRSPQDAELFLFAVPDGPALHAAVAAFAAQAPSLSRAEMIDASAALARRIDDGPRRAAVVAADPAQLAARLTLLLARLRDGGRPSIDPVEGVFMGGVRDAAPRIVFLCPGQAAPPHLTGGAWRRRFDSVDALYAADAAVDAVNGTNTDVAQPAITLATRAGLAVLAELGVVGDAAIGHSLGELSALHWAGAYDGIVLQRLAAGRGRAMADHCLDGGAMLAVFATIDATIDLLRDRDAVIACYNGPHDCVVAGEKSALAAIETDARARGIAVQVLPVSHAFHSRFAAPAAAAVAALVGEVPIAALQRAVFSTVEGRRLEDYDDVADVLARQVAAPVRFAEAWTAAAASADLAIEVGPGQGLTRLASGLGGPPVIAIDAGGSSLAGLLSAVGAAYVLGTPIRASVFDSRFHRPFDLARPRRFFANPCERAAAADPLVDAIPSEPVRLAVLPDEAMGATPFDALRGLLARRLDLATDAIRADHRLFADLHLNSIAVGQVVAQAARALGVAPPASSTNYALATVGEAAAALSTRPSSPDDRDVVTAPGVDSWVRPFVAGATPQALRAGPQRAWQWRVVAQSGIVVPVGLPPIADPSASPALMLCLADQSERPDLPLILRAVQAAMALGDGAMLLVAQDGDGDGEGGAAAVARCLSLERPDMRVVVVTLPFDDARSAGWLLDEAGLAAPGYGEARYDRAGVRTGPALQLLDVAETPRAVLGPGDVVLVSGGGSGIGAECALALAKSCRARIAILGRSPADSGPVQATLARFHAAGVEASYEPADVCDGAAVAAAVGRLRDRLGPITAVVHAAGVNRPLSLVDLDLATLQDTVAVKVAGFANLIDAVRPADLKLVVGFSSIIARIGMPGEAHYAVANEWLGVAIGKFGVDHPTCRCLALEWSVWEGVGMGERLGAIEGLGSMGVAALPASLATEMFVALVQRPAPGSPIIVTGRYGTPATIGGHRGSDPTARFLERVVVQYPGVEIVADTRLDLDSDPYLVDHALAGSPIFPAVLGLEAMVQAAAEVAGGARPDSLADVVFARPVVVSDSGTIRVAALARGSGRVDLVLRSDESSFQVDHFTATALFGPQPGAGDSSPLAPAHPMPGWDAGSLYEQLLFHRGRFRRIAGYDALSATRCVARIAPAAGTRWFSGRDADALRLGDPGARDAALHALQACIPQSRVLPVAVKHVRLGRLDPARAYVVHGVERLREADTFTFDVEIRDESGDLVEAWDGLQLKAIETLTTERPWPPALIGPLIERRFDALMPGVGLEVRFGEQVSSDGLFAALFGAGEPIHRRSDGRPEGSRPVSAAHIGAMTLATASRHPVGCDIALVEHRDTADWRGMIGERFWMLAQTLAKGPGGVDEVATRVWVSLEALKKAGASMAQAPLVVSHAEGDAVVLASGGYRVVTWAGDIAVGSDRVAGTRVVIGAAVASQPHPAPAFAPPPLGYSFRHIVGFGDTNVVGNVYFAHFVEWQGRCREMFLRDKAPSIAAELSAGLALVTTHCSCEFVQELQAFDEVRLEMRLKDADDHRIELAFDYWCSRDGGAEVLAARGAQGIACLRTSALGKSPTPIPPALVAALRPYGPSPGAVPTRSDGWPSGGIAGSPRDRSSGVATLGAYAAPIWGDGGV